MSEQGEGIILSREVKVGVNSKDLKDMKREPWRLWGAGLTCAFFEKAQNQVPTKFGEAYKNIDVLL